MRTVPSHLGNGRGRWDHAEVKVESPRRLLEARDAGVLLFRPGSGVGKGPLARALRPGPGVVRRSQAPHRAHRLLLGGVQGGDQLSGKTLGAFPLRGHNVRFTPDGRRLVVFHESGSLELWDLGVLAKR